MKKVTNNRLPSLFVLLFIALLTTQCQYNEEDIVPNGESRKAPWLTVSDSLQFNDSTDTDSVASLLCADCDHVVTTQLVDGNVLDLQPGDVIGLPANIAFNNLKFDNIIGTEEQPIIIKNCGGTAVINSSGAYGITFKNSKHFKLVGNGSGVGGEYGIKVTTKSGFYILMELFTTNFEIAHVEVAGANRYGMGEGSGFAGIGVKTSPYQDCDLFTDPTRTAWIMRDVSIHDNYIHDTGGEGLYIGHGFYGGRKESKCSSVTYSHSIKGLRVYNNLIEDVGFDGMQIKNADEDVKVYNNVVRNYGTLDHGAHNEGLLIGAGTVGQFYNNIIDTGTGHGCFIQAYGNLDVYNNVFANSGDCGINVTHGPYVIRGADAYFNFFNNTIYNSSEMGFVFHNNDGGPKRLINNLIVKSKKLVHESAPVEMLNNLLTNDPDSIGFVDWSNGDFKLQNSSGAVDAGVDLTQYGIVDDCEGTPRPRGRTFDVGAYEM